MYQRRLARNRYERERYRTDTEFRTRVNLRQKKYAKARWHGDPEVRKARYRQDAVRKTKVRTWFANLRADKVCINCGEGHPACLEFHHREPREKKYEISNLVSHGAPIQSILIEIAKCDVLCANCHRKLHWQEKQRGADKCQ